MDGKGVPWNVLATVRVNHDGVTPISKEQMECIILRAPRDQSHIR
jgi:hypothetical protein